MKNKNKKMKHKIKYIVVHSTQTHPHQIPPPTIAHYSIYGDGRVVKNNPVTVADGCIDVAYIGGKDKDGKLADTKTDRQAESLFNQLVALTYQHPVAVIKAADKLLGKDHAIGFNLADWLANYVPSFLSKAA